MPQLAGGLMFCPEGNRLMDNCRGAAQAYSAAVLATHDVRGAAFLRARYRTESQKQAYQSAQEALDNHERQHQCTSAAPMRPLDGGRVSTRAGL